MGSLSDVVSYLFGLALNLLDAAINGFLGALGFDLDTFEHYFPAAADYHEVIVGHLLATQQIVSLTGASAALGKVHQIGHNEAQDIQDHPA